jgi:hypothetical protein
MNLVKKIKIKILNNKMSATIIIANSVNIFVSDNSGIVSTNFQISGSTDGNINPPGMFYTINYSGPGEINPLSGPMQDLGSNIYNSDIISYTPPAGFVGDDITNFILFSEDPPLTSNVANLSFNVVCLHSSTKILTKDGYQKISTLNEGDYVITSSGKESRITKVVITKIINNNSKILLSIPEGAISPNYPSEEILLSYGHSVLLEPEKGNEGKWMMATNLPKYYPNVIYPEIEEPFVMYNLHLENFFDDNLVVNNGFIVESLGDGKTIWKEDGDYRYKDPSLRY